MHCICCNSVADDAKDRELSQELLRVIHRRSYSTMTVLEALGAVAGLEIGEMLLVREGSPADLGMNSMIKKLAGVVHSSAKDTASDFIISGLENYRENYQEDHMA